jgi:Sec-independent protein translocase protein TatA
MLRLGPIEIFLIVLIIFIIFGAGKLTGFTEWAGRSLGKLRRKDDSSKNETKPRVIHQLEDDKNTK